MLQNGVYHTSPILFVRNTYIDTRNIFFYCIGVVHIHIFLQVSQWTTIDWLYDSIIIILLKDGY